MRTVIVVESSFGNTRAVAEAVAAGAGDADVCDVGSADRRIGPDVDLLVVGGPTHAFGMTRPRTRADAVRQGAPGPAAETGLREWLAGLEARRGLPVATFDTRVDKARRLPGSAARAAAKALRRRGLTPVGRPESFYVTDTSGPLLDGELARARTWGATLSRQTSRG